MRRNRPQVEYEFRTVKFQPQTTRSQARQELTDAAEYGKWELARTRIGMGGTRTVWLRRKIMNVPRTA